MYDRDLLVLLSLPSLNLSLFTHRHQKLFFLLLGAQEPLPLSHSLSPFLLVYVRLSLFSSRPSPKSNYETQIIGEQSQDTKNLSMCLSVDLSALFSTGSSPRAFMTSQVTNKQNQDTKNLCPSVCLSPFVCMSVCLSIYLCLSLSHAQNILSVKYFRSLNLTSCLSRSPGINHTVGLSRSGLALNSHFCICTRRLS